MRLFRTWLLYNTLRPLYTENKIPYQSGPLLPLKPHLSVCLPLHHPQAPVTSTACNLSEAPCCSLCTPCCFPTPRLLPYLKYPPRLVCLPITDLSVMRQFKCCLLSDAFPYPHPRLLHQRNQPPYLYIALTVP